MPTVISIDHDSQPRVTNSCIEKLRREDAEAVHFFWRVDAKNVVWSQQLPPCPALPGYRFKLSLTPRTVGVWPIFGESLGVLARTLLGCDYSLTVRLHCSVPSDGQLILPGGQMLLASCTLYNMCQERVMASSIGTVHSVALAREASVEDLLVTDTSCVLLDEVGSFSPGAGVLLHFRLRVARRVGVPLPSRP